MTAIGGRSGGAWRTAVGDTGEAVRDDAGQTVRTVRVQRERAAVVGQARSL